MITYDLLSSPSKVSFNSWIPEPRNQDFFWENISIYSFSLLSLFILYSYRPPPPKLHTTPGFKLGPRPCRAGVRLKLAQDAVPSPARCVLHQPGFPPAAAGYAGGGASRQRHQVKTHAHTHTHTHEQTRTRTHRDHSQPGHYVIRRKIMTRCRPLIGWTVGYSQSTLSKYYCVAITVVATLIYLVLWVMSLWDITYVLNSSVSVCPHYNASQWTCEVKLACCCSSLMRSPSENVQSGKPVRDHDFFFIFVQFIGGWQPTSRCITAIYCVFFFFFLHNTVTILVDLWSLSGIKAMSTCKKSHPDTVRKSESAVLLCLADRQNYRL